MGVRIWHQNKMEDITEYCITCKKVVHARNNAITCDRCEKWNHIRCNTGVTYYAYKKAIKGKYDIHWVCGPCTTDDIMPSEPTDDIPQEMPNCCLTPKRNLNNTYVVSPASTFIASTPVVPNLAPVTNSPNIEDIPNASFLTVDEVPSLQESNLVDSFPQPDDTTTDPTTNTEVSYNLIKGATSRGKDTLVDSLGYTYIKDYDSKKGARWRCSVRNSTTKCSAAVNYNKDTVNYTRTEKLHLCQPKVTAVQNVKMLKLDHLHPPRTLCHLPSVSIFRLMFLRRHY